MPRQKKKYLSGGLMDLLSFFLTTKLKKPQNSPPKTAYPKTNSPKENPKPTPQPKPTGYSTRPGAPKGTYTPPKGKTVDPYSPQKEKPSGTCTPPKEKTVDSYTPPTVFSPPAPTAPPKSPSSGGGKSTRDFARQSLLRDMRRYADSAGLAARMTPYNSVTPTYAAMSYNQRSWYFYWRAQVRNGIYPETDRGYILLHGYELISDVGTVGPLDGFEQLLRLAKAYGEHFPDVGQQLLEWSFGLAYAHGLGFESLTVRTDLVPGQDSAVNLMIADHAGDRPLKLPFCLVRAISDYDMTSSKFYKEGNEALVREAIPRILALVDAALVKKSGKGLLATYGPNRTRKQVFLLFPGAQCPAGDERQELSVPAYRSSQKLRGMVTELVRYGENILRAIRGSRGRLRGVKVEPELAALIEGFLKREYGEKPAEAPEAPQEIKLDFDEIDALRQQSDEVREALRVEEPMEPTEKLTELREVLAVVQSSSAAGAALLEHLSGNHWHCVYSPVLDVAINQINALAQRYLARAILVTEGTDLIAEDDYLDELEHIYATGLHKVPPAEPPKPRKKTLIPLEEDTPVPVPPDAAPPEPQQDNGSPFDLSRLTGAMAEFVGSLTPLQAEVIVLILRPEDPTEALRRLADDAMTMPELLFDEVNDMAMTFLDDILLEMDGDRPRVLAQYAQSLRESLR